MAARYTRVPSTAVWNVAEKFYIIARKFWKLQASSVYLDLQLHELEMFKIFKVPEYKTDACLLVSGYKLISSAQIWYVFLELDCKKSCTKIRYLYFVSPFRVVRPFHLCYLY